MTALCGFASSFVFLLIARVGVAIGEAGSTPPSNSLIGDYFKPKSRANALGIFAMGVTIGGALAAGFGGLIVGLTDETVVSFFAAFGMPDIHEQLGWGENFGWRFAFIALGVPGLVIALILFLTVKEPPRGYSDPPGVQRVEKASIAETLKELGSKPTFWTMALGAALVALGRLWPVRLPGADDAASAWHGAGDVRASVWRAAGADLGGRHLPRRLPDRDADAALGDRGGVDSGASACWSAIPLYIAGFYTEPGLLQLVLWGRARCSTTAYLGAQYTIGQGVVSQRSRASAIAILLFIIALIGNGLGPQIVGILSDMFMRMQIEAPAWATR